MSDKKVIRLMSPSWDKLINYPAKKVKTAHCEAAAYLDAKMCAIRDSSRVKGTDRIAVMAASV
jgi:hypothetical protein